jgi:NADH dehydrogenase FAD-containing subunit
MGRGKSERILILGGGYVGFYAALGLQRRLRGGEASVTVVDPQPHMTYQPFLPEAAAGAIEPRHVVVPLRRTLKRCHVVTARVTKIAHEAKKVTVETPDGQHQDLDYDVLVEAAGRILPEVRESLGVYTVLQLERRGIEVYLSTLAKSFENGHVVLSDGTEFDSDTIVWTAGVKSNPVIAASDLPVDDRGRVRAKPTLQVDGVADAWTAGDNAAVPDLSRIEEDPDALCAPNAQHAVRQANVLAKNIIAVLRGREPKSYKHRNVGSVASLGLHKGVADVYNVKAKGFIAWAMHRGYHVGRVPTFNRKFRVVADWLLSGLLRREVISMGQINNPRAEFDRVSRS